MSLFMFTSVHCFKQVQLSNDCQVLSKFHENNSGKYNVIAVCSYAATNPF